MDRARATALALVNWKGVFYERYLFDRHVTALEGSNGAGKTTVMIAAYVVLLPDMSRLRFTNLGEGSATGGDRGIWGRLGELGRPSYAALEIEVGAQKLIAGVHLARKAEPQIVLTPFVIRNLDLEGRLKELFLLSRGDVDEVPELSDLKAQVAAMNGTLDVFSTAKDYFAALFEHGITPLRLATDEDRNKLNEMLKTSMTGGISRALTTELRSFLLKEETGLSDTLSRMRGNLETCHRTRTEVRESRGLEHEITGIYDAGQAMFTAALLATRERARESSALLDEARAAEGEAQRLLAARDADIAEVKRKHERIAARLAETQQRYEEGQRRADEISRAQSAALRLRELGEALGRASDEASTAEAAYEEKERARAALRAECERARDAYDRAATGAGDLEKGLEELHRNAHAYRRVRNRLEEVRAALEREAPIAEEEIGELLEQSRTRLAEVDVERSRIARELESLAVRRAETERALRALAALSGDASGDAHARARAVLTRFADLKARVERPSDVANEKARALELAERQARAVTRAASLGIEGWPLSAPSETVQQHLDDAESALGAAEEEARAFAAQVEDARRAMADLDARARELSLRAERWDARAPLLEDLEKRLGISLRTHDALLETRSRLARDAESERASLARKKEEHEAHLREANALDAAGGSFHEDLLNLRDELDAELLASRFEEVDPEEAAALEAQLGPLANALIVDDPEAAAVHVSKMPRTSSMRSVFLVNAHAALGVDESASKRTRRGDDVIVQESFGVRVTRVPDQPSLGRRARERRAVALREEAARLEADIEAALSRARTLEECKRSVDDLVADWAFLAAGDPSADRARTRDESRELLEREQASRAGQAAARQRAESLKARTTALRALLGDAYLLALPDYAARAAELSEEARLVDEAREELRRTEDDRRVLEALLDALRAPPNEEQEFDRTALDRERDRLFLVASALSEADENRHALRFADAERALAEQSAIAPALEAQRTAARAAWDACERAREAAEKSWEAAARAKQKADAEHAAVRAHHERTRAELEAAGLHDVSPETIAEAHRRVAATDAERKAEGNEERALGTQIALLEERRIQSSRAVDAARERREEAERNANRAAEDARALDRAAEEASVLTAALTSRAAVAYRGRTSHDLWPEARSKGEVLVDRLRASRGNADRADEVASLLPSVPTAAAAYLEPWLTVRDVLARCLPSQVGGEADPLEALQRLRDHLSLLEDRLLRQETDLRGASEDVARGIDVRLRRAKSQVRRLNQGLEGIRFGNVAAIRVEMQRVEKMDQILRALREGEVQELLFQTTLPIEEALDEIFRRYGGGGRTGGQRILDYREYLELRVEIQRARGTAAGEAPTWESASPTRLSTGEAIGVGAALMMVILTEWERDANLLHQKRETGSLRFLFLDEANRLSQDNLGVLFDLCKNLDLQLLIAAPEVARAEGNTTYRLVRRIDEEGREEVIVSGRRITAAPDLEGTEPHALPSVATPESDDVTGQLELA